MYNNVICVTYKIETFYNQTGRKNLVRGNKYNHTTISACFLELFLQQFSVWTSPQSNECHIHLLSGGGIYLNDWKYQHSLKDVSIHFYISFNNSRIVTQVMKILIQCLNFLFMFSFWKVTRYLYPTYMYFQIKLCT